MNIFDDPNVTTEDGYDPGCYSSLFEAHTRSDRYLGASEKDEVFTYCVVASLIIHLAALAWLVRIVDLTPTSALLKPGERITTVRLVEPLEPEKRPESPPEKAAAISDRDHTALRERLPKNLPKPRAPLGSMESGRQRLAALTPPLAPEDVIKSDGTNDRDDELKPSAQEKPAKQDKRKEKHSDRRDQEKQIQAGRHIDLTPTPEEIAQGLSSFGGGSDFFPEGDPDEVVVDINTREDRFFSYLLHLKKKIQDVWVYPSPAARAGIGGSLTVEFAVANDGRLLYANLVDSSGHEILDQYAVRAIETAAPYFPFPPRMKAKRLRVRANFIYITGNFFRRIM